MKTNYYITVDQSTDDYTCLTLSEQTEIFTKVIEIFTTLNQLPAHLYHDHIFKKFDNKNEATKQYEFLKNVLSE